jgi:hypothetical protein
LIFLTQYIVGINGPQKQIGCALYVQERTLQDFVLKYKHLKERNEHINLAMYEANVRRQNMQVQKQGHNHHNGPQKHTRLKGALSIKFS